MDSELIAEGRRFVRACLRRDEPGPHQLQVAINSDLRAVAETYASDDGCEKVVQCGGHAGRTDRAHGPFRSRPSMVSRICPLTARNVAEAVISMLRMGEMFLRSGFSVLFETR
jgi:hypothetical protein